MARRDETPALRNPEVVTTGNKPPQPFGSGKTEAAIPSNKSRCLHRATIGRSTAEPNIAIVEVDKILAWAHVADCTDASARRSRSLEFPDFDEALQAAAAEASAADWLVTRNTGDFARSRVPVLTPSQFLQRFPLPPVL